MCCTAGARIGTDAVAATAADELIIRELAATHATNELNREQAITSSPGATGIFPGPTPLVSRNDQSKVKFLATETNQIFPDFCRF
jgi:hypothetical protein